MIYLTLQNLLNWIDNSDVVFSTHLWPNEERGGGVFVAHHGNDVVTFTTLFTPIGEFIDYSLILTSETESFLLGRRMPNGQFIGVFGPYEMSRVHAALSQAIPS